MSDLVRVSGPEKITPRLWYLAEPLVELNRRIAEVRRDGKHVALAFGECDGEPGVKVYLDYVEWVLVDMACEVGDLNTPADGMSAPDIDRRPLTLGVLTMTGECRQEEALFKV